MADFYGCCMSSSFAVKDIDAWRNDPDVKRLEEHINYWEGFIEENKPGAGIIAFGWSGQYPSLDISGVDDETDEEWELYIPEIIQRHIKDGECCVIAVSGNEKLRYIGGPHCVVTSKGNATHYFGVAWDESVNAYDHVNNIANFARHCQRIL